MNAELWTLQNRRVVTPEGVRPAAIVIRAETIAEVLPSGADLVVFDPDTPFVVDPKTLHHRETEIRDAFKACCGSTRWAFEMTKLRPFASPADLVEAADRV